MVRTFSRNETIKWWSSLEKRVSSASVLCEAPDGRLLTIKANYKKHWSIPGGIIDADETPKQAAIRETLEEVGITLSPEQVEFTAVIDRVSDEAGHTYQFVFKTKITHEDIQGIVLQENEIDEWALVSREEVQNEDRKTGRYFGKILFHWVNNNGGYIEQTFSYGD